MATDATSLGLSVASPLGMQVDLEVESVQLPAANGEIGILPGHVPILAALKPGVMRYRVKGGETLIVAVGAGFAEADATRVRVITEFFQRPEDIARAEAESDFERATETLKHLDAMLGDQAQLDAQKHLDWAIARLDVLGGAVH